MLVSHRHRFLFVHVAKSGGASIRSALCCGRWSEPSSWALWLNEHVSRMSGHRVGTIIPRHAPIIVAREMIPPHLFAGLFKFAFVRNPWDRLASAYEDYQRERHDELTRHRIGSFGSFVDFVLNTPAEQTDHSVALWAIQRPQLESLIGFQGELLVDFVGHYESLHADYAEIIRRLGIASGRLPHRRKNSSRCDYRTLYSDGLADRVGRFYTDDIAAFQYDFDDSSGRSEATEGDSIRAAAIAGRIQLNDDVTRRGGSVEC